SFALDAAASAYALADDKDAFRKEAWVEQLIKDTAQLAAKAEADEQWLRASRLYIDLVQIEPTNTQWKDGLKQCTRRVRLVATYTPDAIKASQETESKLREEAEVLLNPTTQPATRPA